MNFHKITKASVVNGLGVRVVLWLSGCSHKCEGCHNPETWDCKSGKKFDIQNQADLFKELKNEYIKGITFSGGDPLYQKNLKEMKKLVGTIIGAFPTKDIWIYSGYTWEEIIEDKDRFEIIKYCDVLVDGKYIAEQRDITLPFRGSRNQRIIDIQKSLQSGKVELLNV